MTENFRALCEELVDSVELLLEMRAVDAKPMAITEDRVSRARAALGQSRRCIYNPVQIAECGGPCWEIGPEACDCGALWVN